MREHGDHGGSVPGAPFPRHEPVRGQPRARQHCQVLVVEDDPTVSRLLEIALSPLRVRLEAVPSPQAALDRLRHLPSPHVVRMTTVRQTPTTPDAGSTLQWDALSVTLFRATTGARTHGDDRAARRTLVAQLLEGIKDVVADSRSFGDGCVREPDALAA